MVRRVDRPMLDQKRLAFQAVDGFFRA